jgi:hypothetical protein
MTPGRGSGEVAPGMLAVLAGGQGGQHREHDQGGVGPGGESAA